MNQLLRLIKNMLRILQLLRNIQFYNLQRLEQYMLLIQ